MNSNAKLVSIHIKPDSVIFVWWLVEQKKHHFSEISRTSEKIFAGFDLAAGRLLAPTHAGDRMIYPVAQDHIPNEVYSLVRSRLGKDIEGYWRIARTMGKARNG